MIPFKADEPYKTEEAPVSYTHLDVYKRQAETFAVRQHLDGITDAVNHRIIGIVEQSELEFNHVLWT